MTTLPVQSGLRISWLGRVAYSPALAVQETLVATKIRDPAGTPDTLLLLEHDPVYTIGRTPDRSSLRSAAPLPYPLETLQRGGQAPYHGPGQVVGYPVLDLNRRGRDLHRYLRALEEMLILALAECGVAGRRREGLTGVWVDDRKIASIGVGVRRWVSWHGFAVNVSGGEALTPFRAITPCGLDGVRMTAIESETGPPLGLPEFSDVIAAAFERELDNWLPRAPL